MNRCLKIVLLFLVAFCLSFTANAQMSILCGLEEDSIEAVKQHYQNGDVSPEFKKLINSANRLVFGDSNPLTVTDKPQTPPSADKHDYISIAPYWFPDTTKIDSLPYIRRDGEHNPESDNYLDKKKLQLLCQRVAILGIAYYATGNTDYAKKANEMLKIWFVDSLTRMNPNLNYAQAILGRNDGRGAGVLEGRHFIELLDGVDILHQNGAMEDSLYMGLKMWFSDYLHWLRYSSNGKKELLERNNHGTWYIAQYVRIAQFIDKPQYAIQLLKNTKKRIAWQIQPSGKQPLELIRTKSLSYSCFNLIAYCYVINEADQLGVNLRTYHTPDGRSVRKAMDYLVPFLNEEKIWMGLQIEPLSPNDKKFLYWFWKIKQEPQVEAPASLPRDAETESK